MKADDQKKLNNLYLRYQNYDNDGTKYYYDICFSTLTGSGQQKCRRHTGVEKFRAHIEELMQNYKDVSVITVTDYTGTGNRAKPINSAMDIYLLDVKSVDTTPKIILHEKGQPAPPAERQSGTDMMQGLSGLFAGTEYEGLGNIAPIAKFIEDKHVISRLREKNEEQERRISELERQNTEWQQKYETLNGNFEKLQDDAGDMEDEISQYRHRDRKQDQWVSVLGAAGASLAKNFIRQNPKILSGIISEENLAGILSDEQPHPDPPPNGEGDLTEEEQSRMDDATIVFDWLQTLESEAFTQVVGVISAMRQNIAYAARFLAFLNGSHQIQPR
jgi:TolA-binding protein